PGTEGERRLDLDTTHRDVQIAARHAHPVDVAWLDRSGPSEGSRHRGPVDWRESCLGLSRKRWRFLLLRRRRFRPLFVLVAFFLLPFRRARGQNKEQRDTGHEENRGPDRPLRGCREFSGRGTFT